MAKAQITTPDGISIKVDGTADEVAAVIAKLQKTADHGGDRVSKAKSRGKKVERTQLVDLVDSLIDGGFFKKPRDLAAVKAALAEMGHHYPVTTLSGAMLRKVRSRSLRRLKQEKRWFYTGS
jgi:hypothetical protein